MPGFDHFNFLAPYYDSLFPPREPHELLELAELPVEGALLDIGGGTGRVSQFMNGKAQPVVVADLSFKMLSEARRKDGLKPVQSMAENLPFADSTFSRIIMLDAFHHVYNAQKTAAELWRVLQSGGTLVIEEPDISQFAGKLVAVVEKLLLMRSHIFSMERIASFFEDERAQLSMLKNGFFIFVIVKKRES